MTLLSGVVFDKLSITQISIKFRTYFDPKFTPLCTQHLSRGLYPLSYEFNPQSKILFS